MRDRVTKQTRKNDACITTFLFGGMPRILIEALAWVHVTKAVSRLPIIVQLAPDVVPLVEIALQRAGAQTLRVPDPPLCPCAQKALGWDHNKSKPLARAEYRWRLLQNIGSFHTLEQHCARVISIGVDALALAPFDHVTDFISAARGAHVGDVAGVAARSKACSLSSPCCRMGHLPPSCAGKYLPRLGSLDINAGFLVFQPQAVMFHAIYRFFNETCGTTACLAGRCTNFRMADQDVLNKYLKHECANGGVCKIPMPPQYNQRGHIQTSLIATPTAAAMPTAQLTTMKTPNGTARPVANSTAHSPVILHTSGDNQKWGAFFSSIAPCAGSSDRSSVVSRAPCLNEVGARLQRVWLLGAASAFSELLSNRTDGFSMEAANSTKEWSILMCLSAHTRAMIKPSEQARITAACIREGQAGGVLFSVRSAARANETLT
eukprot:CAMPEP_0115832012 /NCGR_PEP_ID=MMETSP0287-20121206/2435_1 /TAXON_ID=412157 /ORGANISM="Chrysochromulina rotalis, Strain UIO044" /LENGTH=433 /DNA_ID=CAMNT_0003285377 /DNA_START=1 /DNA_END=1302 /DNA_ORIENTATION=-